jgi:hypothetical protein
MVNQEWEIMQDRKGKGSSYRILVVMLLSLVATAISGGAV